MYTTRDSTGAESTVTFKVLVLRCRKMRRVLFLEAGKGFINTLFSSLLLPMGAILHMLSNSGRIDAQIVLSQIVQLCHKCIVCGPHQHE